MIDFNNEIANMNPINLKLTDFTNYEVPIDLPKSIMLYNDAISHVRENDLDLAIVDLKNSLSINPNLYEAIILLGLCYACQRKFGKAKKIFKKLIRYDMYHSLASDYMEGLKREKAASKALDAIEKTSSIWGRVNNRRAATKPNTVRKRRLRRGSPKPLGKKLVLLFSLIAIVIATPIRIHWIPSNFKNTTSTETENPNDVYNPVQIKSSDEKQNTDMVEYEEYSRLKEDYNDLQNKLSNSKQELDKYKNNYSNLLALEKAEKLRYDGDYEKAIDILLELKNIHMDDVSKAKFDKLWKGIAAKEVWSLYNQADSLYRNKKYNEALPKLEKSENIITSQELLPWIFYQIGICHKEAGDYTNALMWLQRVKDEYPHSKYAGYSKNMINKINGSLASNQHMN